MQAKVEEVATRLEIKSNLILLQHMIYLTMKTNMVLSASTYKGSRVCTTIDNLDARLNMIEALGIEGETTNAYSVEIAPSINQLKDMKLKMKQLSFIFYKFITIDSAVLPFHFILFIVIIKLHLNNLIFIINWYNMNMEVKNT